MTIFLASAGTEIWRTFSTRVREPTYRKLKLRSATTGRPVQELVDEALSDYLAQSAGPVDRPKS
jgi:hypothetical protein